MSLLRWTEIHRSGKQFEYEYPIVPSACRDIVSEIGDLRVTSTDSAQVKHFAKRIATRFGLEPRCRCRLISGKVRTTKARRASDVRRSAISKYDALQYTRERRGAVRAGENRSGAEARLGRALVVYEVSSF